MNLQPWKREFICHMILNKSSTTSQMAKAAGCSERTITHIRKTYGCLAVLVRLQSVLSRPRSITPPMLDALCDHLTEKPGLYVDEMVVFLQDEFDILTSTASVKRALCCAGWTKMKAQQRAKKSRTRSLVPDYLHRLSEFSSYHLVYVDESGCDKRIWFRRSGWSPLDVTPRPILSDTSCLYPRWHPPFSCLYWFNWCCFLRRFHWASCSSTVGGGQNANLS